MRKNSVIENMTFIKKILFGNKTFHSEISIIVCYNIAKLLYNWCLLFYLITIVYMKRRIVSLKLENSLYKLYLFQLSTLQNTKGARYFAFITLESCIYYFIFEVRKIGAKKQQKYRNLITSPKLTENHYRNKIDKLIK